MLLSKYLRAQSLKISIYFLDKFLFLQSKVSFCILLNSMSNNASESMAERPRRNAVTADEEKEINEISLPLGNMLLLF
jgi:hypothetical protein